MEIAFEALIRKIENKSLVSGDKTTRLTLDFDSNDKLDILNSLNELHYADRNIMVVLMEKKDSKIEQ